MTWTLRHPPSAGRCGGSARDQPGRDILESGDSTREVLVARLGGVRTVEFYEEDTGLALPPACYGVNVTRGDEPGAGYRIMVTALTLLRDLALFPDRLDPAAEVDDMLITLLPGESTVFHVTGAVLEDPDALGSRPVLRCVNDTVAQTGAESW